MPRAGSSFKVNIYKHSSSLGNRAPLIPLGAAHPTPIHVPCYCNQESLLGAWEEAAIAGTPGTPEPHLSPTERE